jgi:hypothetical protein
MAAAQTAQSLPVELGERSVAVTVTLTAVLEVESTTSR